MAKKTPAAPDPTQVANAQANANRINQITPFGQMSYGSVDANGNYVPKTDQQASQVSLNPQLQDIANSLLSSGGNVGPTANDYRNIFSQNVQGFGDPNALSSNLPSINNPSSISSSLSPFYNLPGGQSQLPGLSKDYSADAKQAQNAVYGQATALLDPQYQQQQRQLDQKLANQGLPVGSEAYTTATNNFNQGRDQAYNNAALQAVQAGNTQASQLAQQDLAQRSQLFGEQSTMANNADAQRQEQYNEGSGIIGLQSGLNQQQYNQNLSTQQNSFSQQQAIQQMAQDKQQQLYQQMAGLLGLGTQGYQSTAPIDTVTPTMDAYNAKVSNVNSQNQTLGNLAGTAASLFAFSDRRLKDNITLVGKKDDINIYEFTYKSDAAGKKYRGVMADEVGHIPGAVHTLGDGYMAVDYSKLPVEFARVA